MQDSDDNWIWGSREGWKSEMCKSKYQEKNDSVVHDR